MLKLDNFYSEREIRAAYVKEEENNKNYFY
jgi:hypothetical protein